MRQALLLLFGALLPTLTYAQSPGAAAALRHYQTSAATLQLEAADVAGLVVTDQHTDATTGVTYVYMRQSVAGLEVLGTEANVAVDRAGAVVVANDRFMRGLSAFAMGKAGSPALSPQAAAEAAARALGLEVEKPVTITGALGKADGTVMLSDGGFAQQEIPARLVYQREGKSGLKLAWDMSILQEDGDHWWSVRVDAQTGALLVQNDWVAHCQFGHEHASDAEGVSGVVSLGEAITLGDALAPTGSAMVLAAAGVGSAGAAAGGSYLVVAYPSEAPSFDARTTVTNPANPTASPNGWHTAGGTSYTITRGNNVYAYEDIRTQNGVPAGFSPDGGASLDFSFPINTSTEVPRDYRAAAITNTFYWSNLLHDVLFVLGFDEAAGNFQAVNTAGGLGSDALNAEALDGSGTANANFATPADGQAPRMQMYQWSNSAAGHLLAQFVMTAPTAAMYPATIFLGVDPYLNGTGLSGDVVLVQDGATTGTGGTVNDGCQTITNAAQLSGKIALMDYRNASTPCSIVTAVGRAQTAGAVGVILASIPIAGSGTGSNPNGLPTYFTGYVASITVPVVLVSKANGDAIKTALGSGTVTGTMRGNASNAITSDLDAGIIAHEYGHGLSNRLTGGPSNADCLLSYTTGEQAGEGWSDFIALLLTMRAGDTRSRARGVGTYAQFEATTGAGIRPARYSPDFSVNNYTYASLSSPSLTVPHGIGFVWATMLWDLAWDLMDRDGIDSDLTNGLNESKGNVKALRLVIDGMKLQPCNPGFVEARDAILAADRIRYSGANQGLIWRAFAKRGVGKSATQGRVELRSDQVAAFDVPYDYAQTVRLQASAATTVESGEFLTYTLTADNASGADAASVVVTAPVPVGSRYVAGSASNSGTLSGSNVVFNVGTIPSGGSVTRTFKVQASATTPSAIRFEDGFEAGAGNWTTEHSSGTTDWTLNTSKVRSGTNAFAAIGTYTASERTLTQATPIAVVAGDELRFWHRYATETQYDGGVVEVSANGGAWTTLRSEFTQNGYNTTMAPAATSPTSIAGLTAFSGNSSGFIESVASLNAYAGQTVRVRFRSICDEGYTFDGWYVDDIRIGRMARVQLKPTVQSSTTALFSADMVPTEINAAPATSPTSGGVPTTTVSKTVPPGTSASPFTLQNTGMVALTWFTETTETTSLGKSSSVQAVPSWLSIAPENGTVPAGSSQTVTMQFNTTGMSNGTYTANVTLYSNDQAKPAQVIPVSVTVDTALPIELASLTAVANGQDRVMVRWTTASETNNAGFGVELASGPAGAWREVAFVTGAGSTSEARNYEQPVTGLFPGAYRFRLRQVDTDGTTHYTAEISTVVSMKEAYALTEGRPNPFATQARFSLVVREAQRVRVTAYDLQGREVAMLFDGPMDALAPQDVTLDGQSLPSGVYFVRATGEHFSALRRVTLVK